ncbi:MAG TPA: sugar ABC transporter permease [Acholeplasmataceae bacterium]|nr:sugar ABC transporter permease [Acholeplasmataceae bacterium]HPX71346.1 sugar ABC transporter permease [Acholeplasmataceae bacterium]
MNVLNRLKTRIKDTFHLISWNVRNFFNRIKNAIASFFVSKWKNTSVYKKRIEKKKNRRQIIYDYAIQFGEERFFDGVHLRYDRIRKHINEELQTLEKGNPKVEELLAIKKVLPATKDQVKRREKAKEITKNLLQAALYLLPVLVLLGIFSFYPIINSFRLVFLTGYNGMTGEYKGLTLFGNFAEVIKDPSFIIPSATTKSTALINTGLIVIISVPLTIIISLVISVALASIKPLKGFFQTIYFLPYVTNALAVGLVFAYMFQATGGLVNRFLITFGIEGGSWIGVGAPYWKAMFVLILFSVWNGLAFKIMVFLSAIESIDKQYYQAASIDATPRFKQFTKITVPLISPSIFYILITSVIGSFKTYSSVVAIFGNEGKPPGADYHMKTIVFYIYDYFSNPDNMPLAAAASIVLFAIILLLTVVQNAVGKRRVHY